MQISFIFLQESLLVIEDLRWPTNYFSAVPKYYVDRVVSISNNGLMTSADKLKLDGIVNATTSTSGLMSSEDKTKLDNIPAINTALFEGAICAWTGTSNPTVLGNLDPIGTLYGDATYVDFSWGVRLTRELENLSGALEFNFTHFKHTSASFISKVANSAGSGADSIWFYAYCKSRPTTEFGTGLTGNVGLIIGASEWTDKIGVLWTQKKSDGTSRGGFSDADSTYDYANIDNGNWHLMEINIVNQTVWFRISEFTTLSGSPDTPSTKVIRGSKTYTYLPSTWGVLDKSGTLMGFGARTGGSDAAHYIRGAVITRSTGSGYVFPFTSFLIEPY